MKITLTTIIAFLFICTTIFSQEKVLEYAIDEKFEITDLNIFENKSIYFVERPKSKKTAIKTKFNLLDSNFEFIKEYTSNEYASFNIVSLTGKNVLSSHKKKYSLLFDDKRFFSDKDIDEDINNDFYYNRSGSFDDVIKINFLTDTKFVAIGRKEGKKFYKKGKYNEIEIFIFQKDLKTLQISYSKLEFPEKSNFYNRGPKLLNYDDDGFMLSYLWGGGSDTERKYVIAKYNYEGKLLKEFKLPIKVENERQVFGILNIGDNSFSSYQMYDANGRNTNIMAYRFANSSAKGNITYDSNEKVFYVYAALKPKKGDSGVLIYKYDINGKLLWQKHHVLPDTNFAYLNSANRYLKFDVSGNFLGVHVYSTKGKNYCDFYILNKETGELQTSKTFRKFKFYKSSKAYNNLYSQYILNDDAYANLILDRKSILSSLYSTKFKTFLNQKNAEGDNLFISYFTNDGVNTIVTPKKEKKFTINKFKF